MKNRDSSGRKSNENRTKNDMPISTVQKRSHYIYLGEGIGNVNNIEESVLVKFKGALGLVAVLILVGDTGKLNEIHHCVRILQISINEHMACRKQIY